VLPRILHHFLLINEIGVERTEVSRVEHVLELNNDLLVLQILLNLIFSKQKLSYLNFLLAAHFVLHSFDVAFKKIRNFQIFWICLSVLCDLFLDVMESAGQLLGQLHDEGYAVLALWQRLFCFKLVRSAGVV